jgi:hypothetical protein
MMTELERLRREAEGSARFRDHEIEWREPAHNGTTQQGWCIYCGKWVQVNTHPRPNQIDIGGPAVALNCERS